MRRQFVIVAVLLVWLFYCLSKLITADSVGEVAGVYKISGAIGEYRCNQKRNTSYVTLVDSGGGQEISFRISRTPSTSCDELRREFPVGDSFLSFYLKKITLSLEVGGREVVAFESAKEKNNNAFLFLGFMPILAALIAKWRTGRINSKKG